ncbi:MAG: putative sugar nucleotidyl transferase [Ignavibacteriales bacterium]|nr:putative sugar nucleotidyl transferase [Ignavibacteriales bacterium]
MKTAICIFEDEGFRNLLPLTYLHPVYDLKCGMITLREKITKQLTSKNVILHVRTSLQKVLTERYPGFPINKYDADNILFINGRLLINKKIAKEIKKLGNNSALVKDGIIAAANLSGDNLRTLITSKEEFLPFHILNILAKRESDCSLINYAWDLVNANGEEIVNDFNLLVNKIPKIDSKKYRSVEFLNKNKIFISKGVEIQPFVFLDASDGPIYIGKNVKIMSQSHIQGPAFIGDSSIIKTHASIYHGTSIGEVCKVGGEIESSIIHSYSNKQHDGYLGHSYLGSWVNIGAGSNNSDLKNNYENITVLLNGKNVDTGSQFVGLIMGDHSKTAIGTLFNTGTIVGVSCNIFGAGFPARNIPSFSWGGSAFLRTNDISKSIEVANIVTKRRSVNLSEAEINLLKEVFKLTMHDRRD